MTRPPAGSSDTRAFSSVVFPEPVPPEIRTLRSLLSTAAAASTNGAESEPLAVSSSVVKARPPKRRIVIAVVGPRRAAHAHARAVGQPRVDDRIGRRVLAQRPGHLDRGPPHHLGSRRRRTRPARPAPAPCRPRPPARAPRQRRAVPSPPRRGSRPAARAPCGPRSGPSTPRRCGRARRARPSIRARAALRTVHRHVVPDLGRLHRTGERPLLRPPRRPPQRLRPRRTGRCRDVLKFSGSSAEQLPHCAELLGSAWTRAPPGWTNHRSLRLLARRVVELAIVESISHETIRRTLKKTG